MDGVYFPPRLPGRAEGRTHAAMRDPASGNLVTMCQAFFIPEVHRVDHSAGEEAITCEKCRGDLARRRALLGRPPEVQQATAAEMPVIAGGVVIRPTAKHLSHDQVVNAGILRLLNIEARPLLPVGCFFTSEADRDRDGQALLRIVDAFDDADLLARAIAAIDNTAR